MTTAIATQHYKAADLAAYTEDQKQLIRRTLCAADVSDDEFALFLEVARRSGLDPFRRQIHAVVRKTKDGPRMTIQTGIDGYRALAHANGLCGIDDATFALDKSGNLESASVTVYRHQHGQRVAYTGTAFWAEYVQAYKDGNPSGLWSKMPRHMLAKCAEALALRKGFSELLSGIDTDDVPHHDIVQEAPRPRPRRGGSAEAESIIDVAEEPTEDPMTRARKAADEIRRTYESNCRDHGVNPAPHRLIFEARTGRSWPEKPGAVDYIELASAYKAEIKELDA